MNLFDEINKGTPLPEPRTPAQFVLIHSSSDDDEDNSSSPKVINRICKPKNPNLYNPDPRDYINRDSANDILDYNSIKSSILETNGGDSHSNKAIERRWKAQVKLNQSQNGGKNSHYKNNPLMRNLLEKKMAELQVSKPDSSSSNSGKTTNGDTLLVNDAMLTSNPDDPDIFFLRDTSKKIKFKDDGFRFQHRGTKKKMTPRQYLIHEVKDEDFIFKK